MQTTRCTTASLLLLAALLLLASPGVADEVILENGDRLTGTTLGLTDGHLRFETAYAGKLSIDWASVARLTTREPLAVVLDDDTEVVGSIRSPEDGRLEIVADAVEEPVTVPFDRIAALQEPGRPAVTYDGNVSASLVSSSGNTESDSRYVEGRFEARTEKDRYTFTATHKNTEEDGRKTTSRSTASLGYDLFFSESWYLNSNALFTEDEFQDLNLRSSLGLAAGFQAWERGDASLSVELGASYVNEDLILAPDDEFAAARWALDWEAPLFGTGIGFFHRQQGLLSLEDSDDVVIQSRTGFRFHLFGNFVATAQVSFDWDNSPPLGLEQEDTTLLLNLGYGL